MLTGRVDDYGRGLVPITVINPLTAAALTLEAWIDTGFTGGLLLTAAQIAALGLTPSSTVSGSMADGMHIVFETFSCLVEWFGIRRPVEAISGSCQFALIGIRLLEDCNLVLDYPAPKLTLTPLPGTPTSP